MSGFTTAVQAAIANWIRGQDMPSSPTSLTLALSETVLTDGGGDFNEPSTNDGYARQAVTLGIPVHTEGAGTKVSNTNALVFGPTTSAWNTVRSVAVIDNTGTVVLKGNLVAPRSAAVGDTLSFGIGTIEFTVT